MQQATILNVKKEVLQAEYDNVKDMVLNRKIVNVMDINISKLNINNLESINIGGNTVKLGPSAVSGLGECLGVTKKFIKIINESGLDNSNKLLNLIVTAIKGKKSQAVTLVYNIAMNEIVNIYNTGSKIISDRQYFDALESILANTPGSYLRNITPTIYGGVMAVIANPKLEFQMNNMADEVFASGMTLDIDHTGMSTSFFTERLVCTNGMVSKQTFSTTSVKTAEKIPDFLSGLLTPEYHIGNIFEFKKRLKRNSNTRASLREVLQVDKKLSSIIGSGSDAVMSSMSLPHIIGAFNEDYMEQPDLHRFLNTNISTWDLVNEITAVSSRIEREGLRVNERTNLEIQKLGGDVMYKSPDLGPMNLRQVFR